MTSHTFNDACDTYEHMREVGRTNKSYLGRLRADLGYVPLAMFSKKMVQVNVTDKRKAAGLTDGAIRRELNLLQAILNLANDMELMAHAVRIMKPKDSEPKDIWITAQDVKTFLNNCDPVFRPFAAFLFFTGARLGEALRAKWEHIANGSIILSTRKGTGKTRRRSVPLHPKLLKELGSMTPTKSGLILTNCGAPWAKHEVYAYWNDARSVLPNAESITPHVARHTFASLLVMAGVDNRTVAELMGHSTMDMMKRYTHLSTSHLKGAVNKLPL